MGRAQKLNSDKVHVAVELRRNNDEGNCLFRILHWHSAVQK
jgi:hypothetical protein